jgi:hypothetical protein
VLRYKVARVNALNAHGATDEAYHAVRRAFVAWQQGESVEDADLLAAFEARREELQPLWLDVYEPFDEM